MKKNIFMVGLLTCLLGTASAQVINAQNQGFTFKFSYALQGKTTYSLKEKKTKTNNIADTYRYNEDSVVDNKGHYKVDLDGKGFFARDYSGSYQKADGYAYDQKYGKIKKNKYTIGIGTKDDLTASGRYIEGSGDIMTYK